MKKIYFSLLLIISCAIFNNCKAQYVTIPDTAFVSWLHNNGYAACMNGNQLDTACNTVLNATSVTCSAVPIRDLTGIRYFKNLSLLDCSNDSLYQIPALPPILTQLNCNYNNLDSLPVLPSTLNSLSCMFNNLTNLPGLPAGFIYLNCVHNQLTILPALPPTLSYLGCDINRITGLPALPTPLYWLSCGSNLLTSIPTIPPHVKYFDCSENQLATLPALPDSIVQINCSVNQLISLPALPLALVVFDGGLNHLTSFPALPSLLRNLGCDNNSLTSLPALPAGLQDLSCQHNQITALPTLPASVVYINCSANLLTALPELPDSLFYLQCENNPALTCLPQIKRIVHLKFDSTISCLPDYGNVTYSTPALGSIPLCGVFGNTSCPGYWNVSGQCYYDQNNNCTFDGVDSGTNYVKTQLYGAGGLEQQIFTGGQGFYSFDAVGYGNYTIRIDTSNLPFVLSCPDSGYLSVSLSSADSLSYNNSFAFKCRTEGFDIGVKSILNDNTIPRPNAVFTLYTIAGDISELYGANCATGINGQVQLIYTGQLSYVGPAPGALTPSNISGDTITWNITDFGTVNDFTAFNLVFQINSNATPGTQACFTVNVTPTNGDYNPSNNTESYCFTIVDALDPNEKEVYPSGNTDTSNHWLTYTIRFQNTGTAPAVNVRITDTLSSNLDPSTFQLLAYSAKNLTQIFGNLVVFNFPNINLPDSATSDSASRGYIQYKIKLKDNLPIGTQIQNTADIYFDLNPAVVTNTTLNTINWPTGIANIGSDDISMNLYPNPAKDYVTIETGANVTGGWLRIVDITGREVTKLQISTSHFLLHTSHLSAGVYIVTLNDKIGRTATRKLVIQ